MHRLVSRLAAALLAAIAMTGCSGPDTPALTSAPVSLRYTSPDPATLPPATPDDAMCYHHSAPSNLRVTTSWGATGTLSAMDGRVYGLALSAVPTNQDLWIAFIDITLCPTKQIWVTAGVTGNGVAVTRTSTVDGHPALAFRLDGSGKLVP